MSEKVATSFLLSSQMTDIVDQLTYYDNLLQRE